MKWNCYYPKQNWKENQYTGLLSYNEKVNKSWHVLHESNEKQKRAFESIYLIILFPYTISMRESDSHAYDDMYNSKTCQK